jgi:drug/metabolite transporter (DMT)-like permease
MPEQGHATGREGLGILLMVVAMLTIPLVDGIAKHLSASYSPLFISWARYAVACMIILPVALVRSGKEMFPRQDLGAHTLRTVFLVTAMTLYFISVSRIPLATAITAYFVGPVIAVLISVVFFREAFTIRKGLSLVFGVMGTLLVLRPGGSTDPGILMAFGAGFFFALYMIATRQASRQSDPFKTLTFQCVVGMFLLLPQALASWSSVGVGDMGFFIAMGCFSAFAHVLSIMAFRYADTTSLAPLVYLELVGTSIIGYLAFNEIPGFFTISGALLIVMAGLVLVAGKRRIPDPAH